MLFVRSTVKEILTRCLVAFAVLVVVFAVEKFDFVARIAFEYGLDTEGFVVLFLSNLPTVMDLIIPIATIVAVYIALLNIRERRELVILAAVGVGSRPILVIAGFIATVALVTSFLISGFVKPAANYAFRKQYERSLSELVSKGPEGGRFFETPDTVVYTSPASGGEDRKLRVFGFEGARLDYIYLSDCARMRIEAGQLQSDTCASRAYRFKAPPGMAKASAKIFPTECPTCDDERARLSIVRVAGRRTEKTFDMHTLFKTIERDRLDERNVVELLANDGRAFTSPENARRGVKDVLVALMNIFAVVAALVAVAVTTPRTRFVALPLGIALLLGGLVAAGSGGVIPDGVLTPLGALGVVTATATVGAAQLVAVVLLARDQLLSPRMRRA